MLEFSDGVKINTTGPLRIIHLADGWYVVGEGWCIPCADRIDAQDTLRSMNARKERK